MYTVSTSSRCYRQHLVSIPIELTEQPTICTDGIRRSWNCNVCIGSLPNFLNVISNKCELHFFPKEDIMATYNFASLKRREAHTSWKFHSLRNIAAITEELVFKWADIKLPTYCAMAPFCMWKPCDLLGGAAEPLAGSTFT